jgi:uncharacterized protein (UPF0212 family)
MDKISVLKDIFLVENISAKILKCSKITEDQLLKVLSKDNYNLKDDLEVTATTVSRYIKILFPDKPTTTGKVCNFLFHKYGYKHCKKCGKVKESSFFYANNSYIDGLSTYCKVCQAELEKPTSASRAAKYKAAKLQRIPCWMTNEELAEIDEFYKNCPAGSQVDHKYPLQGEFVSGLHVMANLQYLTASENASKRNKFTPH